MDELLKKLLEAEILTPETKTELTEAFEQHIKAVVSEAKAEKEEEVRSELTEQWIKDREVLIEAIDSKVGGLLESEIAELKSDIEGFRNLEAEYAEKLVEARATMAEEVKDDMAKLLNHLDSFLQESLAAEFRELQEDIEEVKKNEFGRKIFEAFTSEFNTNFVDEESIQAKLHESESKLKSLESKLLESQKTEAKLIRESKLNNLLSPLSGTNREVMETILETVSTENLESQFDRYIGRVVKESDRSSEKESEVLAESEKQKTEKSLVEHKVTIKTGDAAENPAEQLKESTINEAEMAALRRLAGIDNK